MFLVKGQIRKGTTPSKGKEVLVSILPTFRTHYIPKLMIKETQRP